MSGDIPRAEEPSFDSDGDITQRAMNIIRGYTGCPREWLDFCERCWNTDYGRIRHDTIAEGEIEVSFVTGGWSSNELVISVMHDNAVMWACCWESSHRGGLHVFRWRAP